MAAALILGFASGFPVAIIYQRFVYFKRTGKHLQDQ